MPSATAMLRAAAASFSRRCFSTGSPLSSNIGRQPVTFDPAAVSVHFVNPYPPPPATAGPPPKNAIDRRRPFRVTVTGPLGQLSREVPAFVRIASASPEDSSSPAHASKPAAAKAKPDLVALSVNVEFPDADAQRAAWGTTRAHLANMVKGVTQGWTYSLRLSGTGYRAMLAEVPNSGGRQLLQLKLGFANTIELPLPQGVTAKLPAQDQITLTGADKDTVAQFAATIRAYKPPEPYKMKGIFVNGETIQQKEGKRKR
ncbi:ribosomal protein L6, alpha-beta domain-containing protein [Catenaria anguillulae PL171]|uniref:Ribosomal protein L6, alpha-beta domain-containing protein n=1 Tax=Catenaria anguillulae PL171 TaxID=765915 RepID=A0A1Y2I0H0_9FUNG|nr:ribosomal protein L6, alpha-beta domain-containing protein [Catenaria anguillulae PL171]